MSMTPSKFTKNSSWRISGSGCFKNFPPRLRMGFTTATYYTDIKAAFPHQQGKANLH